MKPGVLSIFLKRFLRQTATRPILNDIGRASEDIKTLLTAHAKSTERRVATVRNEPIDVVVCVHNALYEAERCLNAVARTATDPFSLIVIDDGSNEETAEYLRRVCEDTRATLIRHPLAKGYTAAANAGLCASEAPWSVLLNSDAVPTSGWLDRMWLKGAKDQKVGIIGPISNCAAWQSAPVLNAGGDWQSSRIPSHLSIDDIGRIVARFEHATVEIPFINGFCYMIRRSVIDEIGLFDDTNFPRGYGEEHDFSIRAAQAGWKSIVAGDVYVFHDGSKSHGHSQRKVLARRGEEILASKHNPASWLNPSNELCRTSLGLTGIRARLANGIDAPRLIELGRRKWKGRRLALLSTSNGGASSTLLQHAHVFIEMGVDVTVCVHGPSSERIDLPALTFDDRAGLNSHLQNRTYDAIVTPGLEPAMRLPNRSELHNSVVAYYLHHAPQFLSDRSIVAEEFRAYVETGEFVLLTAVSALQRSVELFTGRTPVLVYPSVDLSVYYPRGDVAEIRSRERTVIAAMLRPDRQWREAAQLVAALNRTKGRLGDRVDIVVFGASDEQLHQRGWLTSPILNLGTIAQQEVANLLNTADIFLDLTSSGALSLVALEAMACGCAVIVNCFGGSSECANHLNTAWIVDGYDLADVDGAIERLLSNHRRRLEIQRNAVTHAQRYSAEASALGLLNALFPQDL